MVSLQIAGDYRAKPLGVQLRNRTVSGRPSRARLRPRESERHRAGSGFESVRRAEADHAPRERWTPFTRNMCAWSAARLAAATSDSEKANLMRTLIGILVLGSLVFVCSAARPGTNPGAAATRLRYPVALALAEEGRLVFTANQRSGTISCVEPASGKLVGETAVGRQLADLILTPDGRQLLAVDEASGELILFDRRGAILTEVRRVGVGAGPVAVQCNPARTHGYVARLWSRTLTEVNLTTFTLRHVALPFAPRKLLMLPHSSKLVLANAFGGSLAVFDVKQGHVESVRELPAHNLRGLTLSADGKSLVLTHQVLHRLGETTRDNVHWGNVVTNNLRALSVGKLLAPQAPLLTDSRLYQLGEAGQGNGDPSGVAVIDGGYAVALSGVGEVALGPDRQGIWRRVPVGRRPTALAVTPDGRRVIVANTFSDSVSVLDLAQRSLAATISLGEQPPLDARDRGEHLLYNARLAHDGWLSCHSCHTDGHTNGQRSDTLGDGTYGAPKRVLSLLGIRDTAPYAWNGSLPTLEAQVHKSIATTMHGSKLSEPQVQDLAAYLRTLAPPPPAPQDAARVQTGQQLFTKLGCANCHTPPAYTSAETYDVGLQDELGQRRFNPPSLRGVGHGTAFFHDGRASTLDEVFTKYAHQLHQELTAAERADLLAFLRSL